MSIKKLFIIFLMFSQKLTLGNQPFTIIIDPFGDSKNTGREIDDTFERGITLQCAEELKKQLNNLLPDVRIVLTRVPGETIAPLQNASFSNRLQADFYLSISFYQEPEMPSHISLFYYLDSPTDSWHRHNPLYFYHVEQAHLIHLKDSETMGKSFLKQLQNSSINSVFVAQGLFGIPYKPLVGIKAPSLAIEAGLRQKDDWKYLISPLTTCIKAIIS
ncbi:MAG: N-acetylmuramoyl-L-alanine amidase [Candidatus Dependentiae bacterium]|nr:N-acetylmuramoyl-L-alanine amidase [Candidatus Dependentiae bacterium]